MEKPLAHKVRPHDLKNIVGQHHLLGEDSVLSSLIANETIPSMIFFGPPGTGKTTTAIAIAEALGRPYRLFNAVTDNKKKLDQLFVEAEMSRGLVVIVDEVHRLNKDKQDILLPHIESGLITMIGATTANPYFSINPAIRSRVHLFEFLPLSQDDIIDILNRASESIKPKTVEDEVIRSIALSANGDARYALNALDILAKSTQDSQLNMNHLSRLSLSMNITMVLLC